MADNYDAQRQTYDVQKPQIFDSEEEIRSSLINPVGRTSYRESVEFDKLKNKTIKKAVDLGVPELNLPDLTTAILTGEKSSFAFAWHTIALINQLVFVQQESGYDMSNLIRFHYNNLVTNLSLSKSHEGKLLQALTTNEIKQVQEHRLTDANGNMDKRYSGLGDFVKRGFSNNNQDQ